MYGKGLDLFNDEYFEQANDTLRDAFIIGYQIFGSGDLINTDITEFYDITKLYCKSLIELGDDDTASEMLVILGVIISTYESNQKALKAEYSQIAKYWSELARDYKKIGQRQKAKEALQQSLKNHQFS